jgi:hypothetical protein
VIRHATRPLTGPARSWTFYANNDTNAPEVKLGRRPGKPDDVEITRSHWHADGTRTVETRPSRHRGQPAVTLDLNAGRSGARTFESPEELTALARELTEAAEWLMTEQMFGAQEGDQA